MLRSASPRLPLHLSATLMLLLAAACDRSDPQSPPADNASPAQPSADAPAVPSPTPTVPPAATAPAAAIPTPYLGTWDQDATACAARFSDMRLVIDSTSLRFYESVAEVQRVAPVTGGGIDVAAVVSGEGMTNETTYRLTRPDGDTLSVTVDDFTIRRVRCR